ncbi:MAG: T9SS type A sorting domain-containing protein, partial [Bacteroidota bacterium]
KSDVKYDLYYAAEDEGTVKVCILNAKGQKLNSCFVRKTKSFKRTYDFSQLEPGEYIITVSNKDGKATQVIKHKVKAKLLQTFVAKLPDTKAVKLHVGGFNPEEPVLVRIYNEDSKLIYKENFEKTNSFSRVYNLDKSLTKTVKVVVENNGEIQKFTYDLK